MAALSLTGTWRSVETEWITYSQTWRGTVLSAFAQPLLYLGAIGFGLGSIVDDGGGALGTDGSGAALDYVAFLAPGLVAATALQVCSTEAIFGTMARTKWRRTWFTAVGTPLMPADLALGHLLWCGFRGGLAAVVYALIVAVLGILPLGASLLSVLPALVGALALAAPMMAWIVGASNEHTMNAANRFVLIPMVLFSGVFFPVEQLPGWMAAVARATPLWHGTVLARTAALGTEPAWPVGAHVAVLAGFVVGGFALALRRFERRLVS